MEEEEGGGVGSTEEVTHGPMTQIPHEIHKSADKDMHLHHHRNMPE